MSRFQVRKVAVLGAGVMGAQIAAHLVNCRVPVVLFDLASKEGPKSAIAMKAIDGLKKLKPAPLGVPEDAALIQPANYEEHLALLGECDLVIEAIAERMDSRLMAGVEKQDCGRDEFVGRELLPFLFGRDELGEEVVARLAGPDPLYWGPS